MSRIQNIRTLLVQRKLDAALISSVPDIVYLTGFSHFSREEREAYLLVTKKDQYVFTDGRYAHAVWTHLKDFNLFEISTGHPFKDLLKDIILREKIQILGIETQNITVFEHGKIKPNVEKTRHFDLSELRVRKEKVEIEKIKKACGTCDQTFEFLLGKIKPGLTEKEIAFELEYFIKRLGFDISFDPIVAVQENAAIPHHKTGNKKAEKGKLILLDFGVKYENYCSDMTRTVFLGKASEEQKKAYKTVLEAQEKAMEMIGKVCGEHRKAAAKAADKAARDHIVSEGYPDMPHSLGHGIGLEVHEAPRLSPKSKEYLEQGMVFSIEPGIYLPDSFGIRTEDLFTIDNSELVQLTRAPKEIIEI